jgi:hypothetical protein
MTDTIATIVDLLEDHWLPGNSDGITPSISAIYDKKRVGGYGGEITWISVYLPAAAEEEVNDLGYNTVNRLEHASIDLRSSESYAHVLHCRDEIKRILRAHRKTTTGFHLVVVKRIKDLSDATRKLWRWVIDIELQIYGEAVS